MGKYKIDYKRVLFESLFLGVVTALSFVILYCYDLLDLIVASLRNGAITLCGVSLYICLFVFLISFFIKTEKEIILESTKNKKSTKESK